MLTRHNSHCYVACSQLAMMLCMLHMQQLSKCHGHANLWTVRGANVQCMVSRKWTNHGMVSVRNSSVPVGFQQYNKHLLGDFAQSRTRCLQKQHPSPLSSLSLSLSLCLSLSVGHILHSTKLQALCQIETQNTTEVMECIERYWSGSQFLPLQADCSIFHLQCVGATLWCWLCHGPDTKVDGPWYHGCGHLSYLNPPDWASQEPFRLLSHQLSTFLMLVHLIFGILPDLICTGKWNKQSERPEILCEKIGGSPVSSETWCSLPSLRQVTLSKVLLAWGCKLLKLSLKKKNVYDVQHCI